MKILSVAVVILISTVGMVESPNASLSDTSTSIINVRELVSAPSFIPEEELYTHIAGGYFSSYDLKTGQSWRNENVDLPILEEIDQESKKREERSIKIVLSDLYYDSRFVYLPEGELILSKGLKDEEIFFLKKLDYVQISGSDIPAYRLSAVNQQNNKVATLIATSIGTEIPQLIGNLYIESENSIESFNIRIRGRNNVDQESHLCKKIEWVSHFTNTDVSTLTHVDKAIEDEKYILMTSFDSESSQEETILSTRL